MRILGVTASGFVDTGAYELISTTILPSAQASVVFDVSSFASTYKHLQIRGVARSSSAAINLRMRVNGDTGSNYAWHYLEGNGSTVASSGTGSSAFIGLGVVATTANQFSPMVIDIVDSYAAKNKTIRSFHGAQSGANSWVGLHSGLWNSTSPITSVSLIAGVSDTWTSGSRFSLYGIKG
jgi:hypothetical protein